jgi:hypothetical protein
MTRLALSVAVGLLGLCACSGKIASGPSGPGDTGADAPYSDDCGDCEQDSTGIWQSAPAGCAGSAGAAGAGGSTGGARP